MQRGNVIALCCALVFLAGWTVGNARDAQHLAGGSTWNNSTKTMQDMYVAGFRNGYIVGARDASAGTMVQYSVKLPPMSPAQRKDMDEGAAEWRRIASTILSPQGPGVEVIVSTVSTFYSDHRNSPICEDRAILFSLASLAGNAATEQELGAARKAGADTGCK
jgi:hypothetical protein